jgi:hypothetical protein
MTVQQEWMPIDSAPKDGTGVVLIDMDCEMPTSGVGWWRDCVWSCIDPECDEDGSLAKAIIWTKPTHWQPLPLPPEPGK